MQQVLNQAEEAGGKVTWFWNRIQPGLQTNWLSANFSSFILPCLAGIILGFLCLVSPLLAIVLSLGIVVVVTSLSKPVILCFLVIGATILTSGMERGRFFPILSVNEISLLGAIAIAIVITLTDTHRKIVIPRYFGLAFIVLIGGVVITPIATFLLQGIQLTISNAFKMIASVQYFLLFWLFAAIPENERNQRKIVWCMLAFGVIVAVVGLLQGLGLGFVDRILASLYSSSHLSMSIRAGRITSLLGSWNSLGIFMMTNILICWAVLFEVNQRNGRWLIMGTMALLALCLIASGSFAGIIGTVIGLLFMQILSQQRARSLPVLLISFFGIILVIILFYPFLQPLIEKRISYQFRYGEMIPQTLLYRIQIWREIFIPAIQKHFPWPVYPTVPSYYAWHFEESQYLLLLFRTGLAGFIGYLVWIGITIGWLIRRYQQCGSFNKAVASAALAVIVVLVVAGFTNEVFSFAGTIDYLWIMLGLVSLNGEKK